MAASSWSTMLTASLVLSFLLLNITGADHQAAKVDIKLGSPAPAPLAGIDCGVACGGRCKLSSRPKLCKRACGSCCNTCGCVPPGTAGNYEKCPCYFKLTTRNNTRKCP